MAPETVGGDQERPHTNAAFNEAGARWPRKP